MLAIFSEYWPQLPRAKSQTAGWPIASRSKSQSRSLADDDKSYKHVHFMLNAVHPETGLWLDDSFEHRRAQVWALGYEREQGMKMRREFRKMEKMPNGKF